MGTAFTQQGQYKRDAFVQLHYFNDENTMPGCTWPGKKLKLTCSRRGYNQYTILYKQLHKESAFQPTGRLTEKQLQFQCVSPPCVCQVRIYFSNSVKKLKNKMMLAWTPVLHTFYLKGKGNAHCHGPIEHSTSCISITGTAGHWFVVREVCNTAQYYRYWGW